MEQEMVYTVKEIMKERFDEMGDHLKEIKIQTTQTNGRVSSLENHKAYLWGAYAALVLLGGVIISFAIMAINSKISEGITKALSEYEIIVKP